MVKFLYKFQEVMNKRHIFACIIFFLVVMIAGCYSYSGKYKTNYKKPGPNNPTVTKQNEKKQEENDNYGLADYPFEITMLDVGQGLCILVRANDEYMVYDGGGRKRSSYVVSYFKKRKINKIKYLIASHYDEDHIAGLIGLLKTTPVKTAILPSYQADTAIYSSFILAANRADTVIYASRGNTYKLGNATIEIMYSSDNTEEKENNKSTVLKIKYGKFTCIVTGDAEYETEFKLINNKADLSCNLYIVGHHGSGTSSSRKFVSAMSPEIAFISVGKNNKYKHPTKKVLNILEKNKVTVYRTDTQGVVTLIYNGAELIINTAQNDIQRKGH